MQDNIHDSYNVKDTVKMQIQNDTCRKSLCSGIGRGDVRDFAALVLETDSKLGLEERRRSWNVIG